MMVLAMGVLLAPEKTATKPIPASKAMGSGINQTNALPRVAPMKNKGVTSPPLKPAPGVKDVKSIFNKKSYEYKSTVKARSMVGSHKPMYLVVPIVNTAIAIIAPPSIRRKGG